MKSNLQYIYQIISYSIRYWQIQFIILR